MISYKYRGNSDRDLLCLSLNQIYAPKYQNLNDPFEALCFLTPQDQFYLTSLKNPLKEDLKRALNIVFKKYRNSGIYSLSRDFDNEVLWALYSNSHRGFCIEYNMDLFMDMFSFNKIKNFASLLHVFYYEKLPDIISQPFNNYNHSINSTSIIGSKSIPWKHENEIRVLFDESGIIDYDHRAVNGIYFGLRTPEEHINFAMKALAGRKLRYYQMTTMPGKYKLYAKEIEDKFSEKSSYRQHVIQYDINLIESLKDKIDNKKIHILTKAIDFIIQIPNITHVVKAEIDNSENLIVKITVQTNLFNLERELLVRINENDFKIIKTGIYP